MSNKSGWTGSASVAASASTLRTLAGLVCSLASSPLGSGALSLINFRILSNSAGSNSKFGSLFWLSSTATAAINCSWVAVLFCFITVSIIDSRYIFVTFAVAVSSSAFSCAACAACTSRKIASFSSTWLSEGASTSSSNTSSWEVKGGGVSSGGTVPSSGGTVPSSGGTGKLSSLRSLKLAPPAPFLGVNASVIAWTIAPVPNP